MTGQLTPPRAFSDRGSSASNAADVAPWRYRLLEELDRGPSGSLDLALDRLTGSVVTLKRLRPSGTSDHDPGAERIRLAREFRVLASLRHPNIVSVLDYGFDLQGDAFFTMALAERARSILEAGRGAPVAVQVDLLIQTLRALLYLGRHGVVHGRLTPATVVVVGGQVRVLDFGVSGHVDRPRALDAAAAGALAYMAPEVLTGSAPGPLSDLYALGMIACELLCGAHPLPRDNVAALHAAVLHLPLPPPDAAIDPPLRSVLTRLLAKNPAERYPGAAEAIAAFAQALPGVHFDVETSETRESLLEAAPLVGRGDAIDQLAGQLREAEAGHGSFWVVEGESGVGKTRLLDEVRTLALASGFAVFRGQAIGEGGGPYHAWRDVLRALILEVEPTASQAPILKALVPDIALRLGRPVADAPPLDAEATQSRLLVTVLDLVSRMRRPTLIVLDDLQWAGSESLQMLRALAWAAADQPLALLGSFRSDEAPHLRSSLDQAQRVLLRRLAPGEVLALGEAMMGAGARIPQVAALLEEQTEGLPLFVVEIVRALAEQAGTLERIGETDLPRRVMSGGMRRVLRRRLDAVSAWASEALETAAVAGKAIDPRLFARLHPRLDLASWLASCAAAGVLERQAQQWAFTHDKLREQVLDDLPAQVARRLHERVADALEAEYPDRPEWFAALAHHWRAAGNASKEAGYAARAGEQALANAAYEEAIRYLERALDLLAALDGASAPAPAPSRRGRAARFLDPLGGIDPDGAAFRLGTIEGGLAEAHYRLGDLGRCRFHAERALAHFGVPPPGAEGPWVVPALTEVVRRAAQALVPVRRTAGPRAGSIVRAVIGVQLKLTETFVYSLQAVPAGWSVLRAVNLADRAGPSTDLARAYVLAALVVSGVPHVRLAERWCRRALAITEKADDRQDEGYILSRGACVFMGLCQWTDASAAIRRAEAVANEVGDLRVCEEARTEAGILAVYHGPLGDTLEVVRSAWSFTARSRSRQSECWLLLTEADLLLRGGRAGEAVPRFEHAVARLDEGTMATEAVWGYGGLALAHLACGDAAAAYAAAARALGHIESTSLSAFWTQQGIAATAEVLLTLWDRGWVPPGEDVTALADQATRACRGLARYARRFRLGRTHALLWGAWHAWLSGQRRRALRGWAKAARVAERLGTPYELERAHRELASRVGGAAAAGHLARAEEVSAWYRHLPAVATVAGAGQEPRTAGAPA